MSSSSILIQPPEKMCFPYAVVDHFARTTPSAPALVYLASQKAPAVTKTYAELASDSHRAAVLFTSRLGLFKGDRALIQIAGRHPVWFTLVMGLLRFGGVPIPGTSLLGPSDIAYRAEQSKARVFIGDTESVRRALASKAQFDRVVLVRTDQQSETGVQEGVTDVWDDELARVAPGTTYNGARPVAQDISFIFFTSGTTGYPKMVVHSHRYPFAHAAVTSQWYALPLSAANPGVAWNLSDMGWAKSAYGGMAGLGTGSAVFLSAPVNAQGAFSTDAMIAALHEHPITTVCAPPTIWRHLITTRSRKLLKAHPPKALVHSCCAGEPMNPSVITTWQEMSGLTLQEGYGQTETVILLSNMLNAKRAVIPGSMGYPSLSGVLEGGPLECKILRESGEETADGEVGDVAVDVRETERGTLFEGYLQPDGTLDRKREREGKGKLAGRRFYVTGDRAARDEKGYHWFEGRDDDIISSGGYRIGPFEVESTLKSHPAVVESAAVASPDYERGSIVKAFVILTVEALEDTKGDQAKLEALKKDIQRHVRENTAPYKYPREVEFVEALPLTVSGKIRRVELRQLEETRKVAVKAKL